MIIQLESDDEMYKIAAELVGKILEIPGCYEWLYGKGGKTSQKIVIDIDENSGDIRGACVWVKTLYDSIHIMQFATVEKYRQKGVGTGLMNWMKNSFYDKPMTLHVSVKNENAIKLYKKMGFCEVDLLHQYYEDKGKGIYTGEGRNAYEMICYPAITIDATRE